MRFTLVACRNADGLHDSTGIEYLLYNCESGTEVILYPSFALLRELIPKGEKVQIIWRPCAKCRSVGIKGFTKLGQEECPLDPFETRKEGGQ